MPAVGRHTACHRAGRRADGGALGGAARRRLEDSLKLLTGGRTADPRHRTLRATLEWSHELLSEPERVLFRRLSVFAGGWTLEAAEEVCSGEGIEQDDVLDLLSELVDKSLVVAEACRGGGRAALQDAGARPPVRPERLQERGEAEATRGPTRCFVSGAGREEPNRS